MSLITVILYSYKNKNLSKVVEAAIKHTNSSVSVMVYEQHPLQHEKEIKSLGDVVYKHSFWDWQTSPVNLKYDLFDEVKSEYVAIITDDTILNKDWDVKLLEHINTSERVVVSGQGKLSVSIKDKYFLGTEWSTNDSIRLTNYVDRNFIFAKKSVLSEVAFPTDVKYLGEQEKLSYRLFNGRIPVYSAPSGTFEDLNVRTIENLYTPFSIEHNYNSVIASLSDEALDWITWHEIDPDYLRKIPYQVDDVWYNPNDLEFTEVEQERFIDNVNGIY